MFTLMLRCGLRVAEVATLALGDLVCRTIAIHNAKGRKGRVVYLSDDALRTLDSYLAVRPASATQRVFLIEKGTYRDEPLSVRGIQKSMEYYAKKTGLRVSADHLRHTMAMQMRSWPPSRICWATGGSPQLNGTAASPTSRSRGIITEPWRSSCKGRVAIGLLVD